MLLVSTLRFARNVGFASVSVLKSLQIFSLIHIFLDICLVRGKKGKPQFSVTYKVFPQIRARRQGDEDARTRACEEVEEAGKRGSGEGGKLGSVKVGKGGSWDNGRGKNKLFIKVVMKLTL